MVFATSIFGSTFSREEATANAGAATRRGVSWRVAASEEELTQQLQVQGVPRRVAPAGCAAIFSQATDAFSSTIFWVGIAAEAEARADSRAVFTDLTASSERATPRDLRVSMEDSMSWKYSSRACRERRNGDPNQAVGGQTRINADAMANTHRHASPAFLKSSRFSGCLA